MSELKTLLARASLSAPCCFFAYRLLSGQLGPWQSAVATVVFLFKQAVDLRGSERPEETSGDVTEFAAGLLAGWLAARHYALEARRIEEDSSGRPRDGYWGGLHASGGWLH